jgi:hypothetical protein
MTFFNRPLSQLMFFLLFSIIFCGACQLFRPQLSEERISLYGLESVVVIGFQAVASDARVSAETVNRMTARLFEGVQKKEGCEFISPARASRVYSGLISLDAEQAEMGKYQQIGKAFSADAVLVGYLYRWRERVGGERAVDQPASVAFELSLIRPDDGAILWREKFDKTQKSLSENLLEWDTFIRGRGRWMTAEKLAELGLEDMLSRMPIGRNEEKE